MKKTTGIITILLASLLLSGCGEEKTSSVPSEIVVNSVQTSDAEKSVFPVKLADGTEIRTAPERAASLSPAATEILAELGFSDKLCAVSRYCDYPEGLNKEIIGSSENPDIDRIIKLAPDVVFTVSPLAEREIYALEAAGITVVTLTAPTSAEDYGELYGTITTVFKGNEEGRTAAELAVSALKTAASSTELDTFIYVTPKKTAAGTDTFESAVLSLCGKNACTGEGYTSNAEDCPEIPKYIVAADSLTYEDIAGSELFSDMVYSGARVLFVPAERFERSSARLCEVFAALDKQLTTE